MAQKPYVSNKSGYLTTARDSFATHIEYEKKTYIIFKVIKLGDNS